MRPKRIYLFIKLPENKLSSLAFEKYGEEIKRIPGVLSVGPGYLDTPNGKTGCLEVHLENSDSLSKIPASYDITLSSGMPVSIPVNKIVTGIAQLHLETIGAGTMVGNINRPDVRGSIGCVVQMRDTRDTRKFILSCQHVLNGSANLSTVTKDTDIQIVKFAGEVTAAILTDGERSVTMDAAIALITDNEIDFTNIAVGNPKEIGTVTSFDVSGNTIVRVYGGKSGVQRTGTIYNDSYPKTLKYDDMPDLESQDLIVITSFINGNLSPISVKGDSGSLVIDNTTNKAIGIVVGGDNAFTYAVKMTAIAKRFKIKMI